MIVTCYEALVFYQTKVKGCDRGMTDYSLLEESAGRKFGPF
jgi:hypothetical protein